MSRLVTRTELAALLGRTPRTVSQYVQDGMPIADSRGPSGSHRFDIYEAFDWFFSRNRPAEGELDLDHERARHAKEQADRVAMENAVRRGELIPADEIAGELAGAFADAQKQFRGIGARVAPDLVGLESVPKIQQMIADAIDDALASLAESLAARGERDEAAAEADGLAVGGQAPDPQ